MNHGPWLVHAPWPMVAMEHDRMVHSPEPRGPRLQARGPEASWSMSVVHGIHGSHGMNWNELGSMEAMGSMESKGDHGIYGIYGIYGIHGIDGIYVAAVELSARASSITAVAVADDD